MDVVLRDEDREILRRLAERVRAISDDPANRERRKLWYRHDEGDAGRPMVLTETDAGPELVQPEFRLECKEWWAREQEKSFREAILHFELLKDDRVVEPWANVKWIIEDSGYGVPMEFQRPVHHPGTTGSYHWKAPLKDLEKGLGRLKPRDFQVNRALSRSVFDATRQALDGILDVRFRGAFWWSLGMTEHAVYLAGFEEFMIHMLESPDLLHSLMAYLRDDRLRMIDWLEREDLLTPNNQNDYVGSGSIGYTRALPGGVDEKKGPLRAGDLWVLSESQETIGVGPRLFEEFVFPYQLDVIRRFGRCYYGCCEPLQDRWHIVRTIPNLKRVSISPWCDQEFMARELGPGVVFSRKPAPMLLCGSTFNEDVIREDVRKTLRTVQEHDIRSVEVIMKDVHTLHGEPWRLGRWVEIAREEIDRLYG